MTCEIENYDDDKHLYYENKRHDVLKIVLEIDVDTVAVWFDSYYMCVNPDEFQSMILDRDGKQSFSISVQDHTIFSDSSFKVWIIVLDIKLNID